MAGENKEKKTLISGMGKISLFLGVILLCGVTYLTVILLQQEEEETVSPPSQVTPLQAGNFTEAAALKNTFGAPLFYLPDLPFSGEARNIAFDGENGREVRMKYENNTVLTAVRPAKNAPLLTKNHLSLTGETAFEICDFPAVLAVGKDEYCFYFQNDEAAYSFYGRDISQQDFINLAQELQKVN